MYPQKPDPKTSLFEALLFGPSESIVASEKRGQAQLVQSEMLPRDCGPDRAVFEGMGIKFGDNADDLFVFVTLPPGWRKQDTDHDMWSDLLDNKCRKRAGIFYKAAFYDRSAHMYPIRFFHFETAPTLGYENLEQSPWKCRVIDGNGGVHWESEILDKEPVFGADSWRSWHDRKESLGRAAETWLNENYPDWRNPLAYWD